MQLKRSLWATMMASALAVGAHAQIQKYVINDLGTTPNSIEITPTDINDRGDVVGLIKYPNAQNAFVWSNGALRDLGTLPGRPGAFATGINNAGRIVGTSGTGSLVRAWLFENDSMTHIFPSDPLNFPTTAGSINNRGSYVFNENLLSLDSSVFVRIQGNDQRLVVTGEGWRGIGINMLDAVVCGNGTDQYGLWEPDDNGSGTFAATTITEGDQTLATPTDISIFTPEGGTPDNAVVGYSSEVRRDATFTNYLVSQGWFDADATYLGVPLPGDNVTEARGANDRGFVVGRSGKLVELNGRASYQWRATIGIPVVDPVLGPIIFPFELSRFVPATSGINLENAIEINEAGQVIATYTRNGQIRAVRLTPLATPISITIPPPPAPAVNFIYGGESVDGIVALDGAEVGGSIVNLSSSSAIVRVPATIQIGGGGGDGTFTIDTSPVATAQTVNITAERMGYSVMKSVQIRPAVLDSISVNPNPVTGGLKATGTVRLRGQAAGTGLNVALTSSNPAVATTIPTVRVAPNTSAVSFNVNTTVVASPQTVVLTARANNATKTVNLVVGLPTIQNLLLNPDTVTGGNPSTGTVILTANAVSNATVQLSSTIANVARVPATVTVPTGLKQANFAITTIPVTFQTQGNISATLNGNTVTKLITVRLAQLFNLELTGVSPVLGGTSSVIKITLDAPAPTGGAVVNLSSSNGTAVVLPASVTIGAGGRTINVAVKTNVIETATNVQIVAQRLTVTKSVNIRVLAAELTGLQAVFLDVDNSLDLSPGDLVRVTATLDRPAQAGGANVRLFSSDVTDFPVPAGVVVPAGQISGSRSFAVTNSGTFTITGIRGPNQRTATVTVP